MRLSSTIPVGALLYGAQYLPGAYAWGAAGTLSRSSSIRDLNHVLFFQAMK
jgi:hypothetical protein